jgi:hypothetical protein
MRDLWNVNKFYYILWCYRREGYGTKHHFAGEERSVDIHSITCLTRVSVCHWMESISLSDITCSDLFNPFNLENFVIYSPHLTNFWCNCIFYNTTEMFCVVDNLYSSLHSILDAYETCCQLISSFVNNRGYVMLNNMWGWFWMVKCHLSPKYLLYLFINLGWWSI